jgi:hypothetical protein
VVVMVAAFRIAGMATSARLATYANISAKNQHVSLHELELDKLPHNACLAYGSLPPSDHLHWKISLVDRQSSQSRQYNE